MTKKLFNNLLVLGTGLIGGSLALAVRKSGVAATVTGWSRREETLQKAVACGAIESYETDLNKALANADCVVIATPTQFAESLMLDVVQQVDDSVLVTDVASVKGNLARALRNTYGELPKNVVLGHPIAGSEKSGITAARIDLFTNQRVILVQEKETSEQSLLAISSLWKSVGAEVYCMEAEQHDQVLALTSHLPHMLAFALVSQLSEGSSAEDVFRFVGGGFRDFTRIAGSDPRMWREISLANDQQLLKALNGFEQKISILKSLLENNEADKLEALFAEAKSARDQLSFDKH